MSDQRHEGSGFSRRSLFQRGAALGAGMALSHFALTNAQTPGASPEASPAAEIDPAFLKAQEELIATLQGQEGKKLKILSAVVGGKTPEEDKQFAAEIKRLTNIEVDLVHPTADYNQKMLADLAAGVKYDLIYTNQDTVETLVAQDVLTQLNDRIENSAILSNPTVIPTDEWPLITFPDGKIYSVFQKFEGARMLTIRQDWLDKLGLETPKTLDEVYDVMVAFRDKDPVGDGSKPLGLGTAGTYDIQPFMSSEGIYPGYIETDGQKTIPYATEAAIPVYTWLAKIYKEGLYDPNFATATTADFRNLFMTNKMGIVTYWDTWVGLFNAQVHANDPDSPFKAEGIAATTGPDGKIILNRGQPSVWTIPVNASDPDTAFQFIEWWNTFPGIILGSIGIQGVDYTGEGDDIKLTAEGQEHAMDHGDPTPYNTNWHNPLGELPGLVPAQKISLEYGYLAKVTPNWSAEVQPILDEFTIKIIQGNLTPEDGVTQMHEKLLSGGFVDA